MFLCMLANRLPMNVHLIVANRDRFLPASELMMFYRAPGELQSELVEMDECMPHYYKITGNHGQGAEKIMQAETALSST